MLYMDIKEIIGTVIVGAIVLGIVALIIVKLIKDKKSNKGGCSGTVVIVMVASNRVIWYNFTYV